MVERIGDLGVGHDLFGCLEGLGGLEYCSCSKNTLVINLWDLFSIRGLYEKL